MRDDEFLGRRPTGFLKVHQRLATSGARAAHVFEMGGVRYLVVPQLAEDIAGEAANMNGGNCDVSAIVFSWQNECFVEDIRLPCPGGEDAQTFELDGVVHLAFANLRTGKGPYEANTDSLIYRARPGGWELADRFPGFAAKQWHPFSIGERQFLALAQGITLPHVTPAGHGRSTILERNEGKWQEFQRLGGRWGYNWRSFSVGRLFFLAYADHVSPSLIYRWDGERFVPYQTFAERGGRSFIHFCHEGEDWLGFAAIDGGSALYRWNGELFQLHQTLGGPGGREFVLIRKNDRLFLVRICFIEGTPAAPKTDLMSQLFVWADGKLELAEEFPTFGGTDACAFREEDNYYLVVSNSLTVDVRFRQDSVVYKLNLDN